LGRRKSRVGEGNERGEKVASERHRADSAEGLAEAKAEIDCIQTA
jgi:hypothetical protein